MSASGFQQRADELAAARSRQEIDDDQWFGGMAAILDTAYPAGDNPRAQSGFGGDEARWEAGRRPIAQLIDRDGTFLDIGCANGYLMECVVRWSHHRVQPYGLELARAVAELARQQRPQWANRIFLGNALTWQPPMRFDFVRVELVYVPDERQGDLLQRLLAEVVAPGGRLIVCGYGSPRSGVPPHPVRRLVRSHGYEPEVEFARRAPTSIDLSLSPFAGRSGSWATAKPRTPRGQRAFGLRVPRGPRQDARAPHDAPRNQSQARLPA